MTNYPPRRAVLVTPPASEPLTLAEIKLFLRVDGDVEDTLATWVLIDEVWADIRPRSGREESRHEGLREAVTHFVYLRYRDDIESDWRILYEERELRIHAVINIEEEGKLLKLWVEESS
ncbi:MAG: phage head closure protein [Rickettsiales bacterium]|nr:phage head closure protein [Rickettsiales bacterium]